MSDQFQANNISSPADSSDTIAMILEIVFGFFGILGMGWLYAGNIPVAIGAFVGFLIVALIEIFIATITLGFAACFIVPFNLVIAIISGLRARDYMRNTGAPGSVLYVVIGVLAGAAAICGGFFMIGLAMSAGN